MTARESLLLSLLAIAWLVGAVGDRVVSGTVTVTPATAARGVSITADATSPVAAPLGLAAQGTDPSSCSIGDLAVVGTTLRICTAADTWSTVGTQGCLADAAACTLDAQCCTLVCNGITSQCGCSALNSPCATLDDCCPGADACTDLGAGNVCTQL